MRLKLRSIPYTHGSNVHDATVPALATDGSLTVCGNLTVSGTATLKGNTTVSGSLTVGGGTDYITLSTGGHLTLAGSATVWEDSQASAGVFRTGVAGLTLATMMGTIAGFRFDLNDEAHVPPIQISHAVKVGSVIKPHLHLINTATMGAASYKVNVQFEWWWANISSAVTGTTTETATCSFQNTGKGYHGMFNFSDITPSVKQGGISSLFAYRLKRTAALANAYNAATIYMGGFDLHVEQDTMGSAQPASKT